MAGDWAYDELLPIAAVELTILGSAVVLCVDRRGHCLFPLPECPSRYAVAYVQLGRLRRRATRFLMRNYLSRVAFESETDIATTPVDVRYSPKAGIHRALSIWRHGVKQHREACGSRNRVVHRLRLN